jgi:hypothetical protein
MKEWFELPTATDAMAKILDDLAEAKEAKRIAALPAELRYIEKLNRTALQPFGSPFWVVGRMQGFYK